MVQPFRLRTLGDGSRSELENPFGHNPNDLPLGVICNTMLRNTENIIAVNANSDRFSKKDSKFRP